jgi:hypothetical protein
LASHSDKKALSETILQRVENFVLAPATFDGWTEGKRKAVVKFFNDSAMEPKAAPKGVDLLLF